MKSLEERIKKLNRRLAANDLHNYRVHYFDEMDEVFETTTAEEMFNSCFFGKYHPRDSFFYFDIRGNIVTVSYDEIEGYIFVVSKKVEEAEKWRI